MAEDDARGGRSGADSTGQAGGDETSSSSQRMVVRTPSGAGDSQMVGAAETAAISGQALATAQSAPTMPQTDSDPAPGSGGADTLVGQTLLERYEITRKIGQGGMGAVYEAKHKGIGKRVAIKVLLDKYAHNDQVVARLKQEAKLATSIGHEHIIDINDIDQMADGRTFVVMEYLDGESLGACLQREGALPEQRAVRIAYQVASALHAVHKKGVLHRDIKPENVFLLKRSNEDFAKVVDFGISKMLRDDGEDGDESPRLTQTGMVLGTPLYMSPEQARGADEVDCRIDVYSVGVILYEMVTGEVPFRGKNYLNIISRVLNDPPTPPRELKSELSVEIEAIILRALAKDPDDRYGSCEELAADLAVLIDDPGRTTARGLITAVNRQRKSSRSGLGVLAWIAGLAAVIGAVVATVAVLMSNKHTAASPPPKEPPPPQRQPPPPQSEPPPFGSPPPRRGPPPHEAKPPPPVQIATIEIISRPPGATIYAGGRVIGTTPFEYKTPKENHRIELIAELEAHNDTAFTINPLVDDGKPVRVRLKKPRRGRKVRKIRKTGPDHQRRGAQSPGESSSSGTAGESSSSGTAGGELSGNPYKRRAQ